VNNDEYRTRRRSRRLSALFIGRERSRGFLIALVRYQWLANARFAEVTAIGRLLTDYNNLEVGLLLLCSRVSATLIELSRRCSAKGAKLHESMLPKRLVISIVVCSKELFV
jgi:hypothetical protein